MLQSLIISIVATGVLFVVSVVLANLGRRGGAVGTMARDAEKLVSGGLRVFQIVVGICLVGVGLFSILTAGRGQAGPWSWVTGVLFIALGIWQIRGSRWIIF